MGERVKQKLVDEDGNFILQDNKLTRMIAKDGKLSPQKALALYLGIFVVAGAFSFYDIFIDQDGYVLLWPPVLAVIGLGLAVYAVGLLMKRGKKDVSGVVRR